MCILTSHAVRAAPHHHLNARWGSHCLIVALLCAASMFQVTPKAWGQCSARDVLQNQLKLGKVRAVDLPQKLIEAARDVPTWKTIAVGTFGNSVALRNALDVVGCNIGGLAAEVLARPAFTVSSSKMDVALVAVSAVDLGFKTGSVPLAVIYARARQLGFELAAAEVGPQLRLQYLDQPVGEFLIVGMQPIKTWSGESVVLNVANGGAGLILIGQDGRDDAEIPATSRFLFVRPPDLSGGIAAALLPP
ncbi:hypothetical protein M2189_007158 [Bradyrhizobium japonicum]|uniref:hypothetical protein n=1 Tax=Bradyrhizobium japonicum TaxID=375 RepID=UPI002167EA42|nr:hypothetical protein [Bradyrhizobium japonicum]MCS3503326.1 hypothetical protein [Bradyrhizobium japonicum]MCS3963955.1 hypothetical protein [Bradyrhizobium japonicum]MCS3996267.1 hypothetical protein [Bradyrhizobium japonicum]